MKNFSPILLMAFALLITSTSFGQQTQVENEFENVRAFRIGVKTGIPNLISANVEYVLPLLNRKFALSADYSKMNMDSGDFGFDTEEGAEIMEQEFDYFEAGINYYFFNREKVCTPESVMQIMV